ncbi:MAG: hypothetical protein ACHQRM_08330 [Bacteroidia bacterium]
MTRRALFLFIPLAFVFQACQKSTLINNPTACMTLSTNSLHLHDTLVIHNCSVADQTFVAFTDSTKPDLRTCHCSYVGNLVAHSQDYRYQFSQTGRQYVHLIARNYTTGSRDQYVTQLVNVLP